MLIGVPKVAILKPGLYQARNTLDPSLIMFHEIEFVGEEVWVTDVPNPQKPEVKKRRRRLEEQLRVRLEPVAGGVGDKAMLPMHTAADRKADDPTILTQEQLDKMAKDVADEGDDRFTHLIDTAPEL